MWASITVAVLVIACSGMRHRQVQPDGSARAPVPVAMDPGSALGPWKSSLGLLTLEPGPNASIIGSWSFTRRGESHSGNLEGHLDGNVLRFRWSAPSRKVLLVGQGWIAFDPDGQHLRGEWWTDPLDGDAGLIDNGDGSTLYPSGHRITGFITAARRVGPVAQRSY